MAVTSSDNTTLGLVADGTNLIFAYDFFFDRKDDVRIIYIDSNSVETILNPNTYDVVFNTSTPGNIISGGDIVFTAGNAPAAGGTVNIYRRTLQNQRTIFSPGQAVPGPSVEDGLDRLTRIVQDLEITGGSAGNPVTANDLSLSGSDLTSTITLQGGQTFADTVTLSGGGVNNYVTGIDHTLSGNDLTTTLTRQGLPTISDTITLPSGGGGGPADTDALPEGSNNLYYTEARVTANASVAANTAKRTYPQADETKLAGVAAGAEVNVQADWDETNTNSDAFIQNKPNISSGAVLRNYLINPNARVNQRAFAGGRLGLNEYGYDRWRGLGDQNNGQDVNVWLTANLSFGNQDFGTIDGVYGWSNSGTPGNIQGNLYVMVPNSGGTGANGTDRESITNLTTATTRASTLTYTATTNSTATRTIQARSGTTVVATATITAGTNTLAVPSGVDNIRLVFNSTTNLANGNLNYGTIRIDTLFEQGASGVDGRTDVSNTAGVWTLTSGTIRQTIEDPGFSNKQVTISANLTSGTLNFSVAGQTGTLTGTGVQQATVTVPANTTDVLVELTASGGTVVFTEPQVNLGSIAGVFEEVSVTQEQIDCFRYWLRLTGSPGLGAFGYELLSLRLPTGNIYYHNVRHPFRGNPTIESTITGSFILKPGLAFDSGTLSIVDQTPVSTTIQINPTINHTAATWLSVRSDMTGFIALSAEYTD